MPLAVKRLAPSKKFDKAVVGKGRRTSERRISAPANVRCRVDAVVANCENVDFVR